MMFIVDSLITQSHLNITIARSKNDEMKRPGTGGGPRVKDFSIPEQILLEHFGDSASLAGVPNAIDTDGLYL
ncbi:hypothetical protein DPMN_077500 [Dreissena polymorpha]|uniref:Uncharacterized protein n=1 Tax=Dreissena polymorpha TaxID=45954 RepID=A0A9D3YL13_DREPO|nr:hypothetical protein DPMN_077500 [Dreissena polymorpha]